jgi:hypothetical protein
MAVPSILWKDPIPDHPQGSRKQEICLCAPKMIHLLTMLGVGPTDSYNRQYVLTIGKVQASYLFRCLW